MPSIDPKAPGCIVTGADTGRIITSCAIFMSFFSFGGCLAALGSALPQIAHDQGVEETSLGYVFIARGSGYLAGTLGSALLIEIKFFKGYKMLLASSGILLSGVALALMPHAVNVSAMYVLIVLQGLGFGSIDSLCNIVLPEIWGDRVQPWMQAAHANFGLGGIVGPALVGYLKYKLAFALLGLTSCLSLVLTIVQMLYERVKSAVSYDNIEDYDAGNNHNAINRADQENQREEIKVGDVEMLQLTNDGQNDGEEKIVESKESPALYPPLALKLLLASFFFVYVGIEIGYGGWIASYVILEDLTESHAKAAYINAVFFMTLSFGRLLAIVLAIWISNTAMLRFQLVFSIFSALFIVALGGSSYFNAVLGAGFFGFACSSMFPLVMTVVGDYGFTMDSSSTLCFVLGSTFGEAIIPVCIGFIMKYVSPSGMNICVLVSVILLIVIYVVADWMMKSHAGHPVEVENISIETRGDHNDDGEVVEVKNVGISQKNILLTTQSGDD